MNKRLAVAAALATGVASIAFALSTNRVAASAAATTGSNEGETLLYIVPRDQIEGKDWEDIWNQSDDDMAGENELGGSPPSVYVVEDIQRADDEQPFEAIFGRGAIIVPVDEEENLYRLIAANAPEENERLSPLRLDTERYRTTMAELNLDWNTSPAPKNVMMQWAEWWQTETNATPVVLILLQF